MNLQIHHVISDLAGTTVWLLWMRSWLENATPISSHNSVTGIFAPAKRSGQAGAPPGSTLRKCNLAA